MADGRTIAVGEKLHRTRMMRHRSHDNGDPAYCVASAAPLEIELRFDTGGPRGLAPPDEDSERKQYGEIPNERAMIRA